MKLIQRFTFLSMRIAFWIVLGSLFLTSCVRVAFAQVAINEVLPNPSTGASWAELKNLSDKPIKLTGWHLDIAEGRLVHHPGFTDFVLGANSYAVFELSSKFGKQSDELTLSDPSTKVIDHFLFTSSEPNQSWARTPDGTGSFVIAQPTRGTENLIFVPSSSPSPSPVPTELPTLPPTSLPAPLPTEIPLPTSTPAPQPTALPNFPSSLQLIEAFPCNEKSDKQWIKIFNPDLQTYDIKKWHLQNANGKTITMNFSIAAKSSTTISWASDFLHKKGDTISLIRPDGVIVFSKEYEKCVAGQSIRFDVPATPQPVQISHTSPSPNQPLSISSPGVAELPSTAEETSPPTPTSPHIDTNYFNEHELQLSSPEEIATSSALITSTQSALPVSRTQPIWTRTLLFFALLICFAILVILGKEFLAWYRKRPHVDRHLPAEIRKLIQNVKDKSS